MPPSLEYQHNGYKQHYSYDGLPSSMQSPMQHSPQQTSQRLQAQEHFDPSASTQSMNSNTSAVAIPTYPIPKPSRTSTQPPIDSLAALVAKPVLRDIPWKEGKGLNHEQILKQSARIQTRGAFLVVTRGEVRDPPCTRCSEGTTGRFALCVSDPNWFKGACATCEMATRGNLCSLRKELEENENVEFRGVRTHGVIGLDAGQASSSKPSLDELESPISEPAASPVSLKRKRESNPPAPAVHTYSNPAPTPAQSYTNHTPALATQNYANPSTQPAAESYASPYMQNAELPWDQRIYTAPVPNKPYPPVTQPPSYTHEPRPPLLDYVFQKQNPPNGTKRHHLIQRAQRDSQEPTSSRPSPLANGHTTYSVNAYTGDPVPKNNHTHTPRASTPTSLSPNVQLQQPSWDYKTTPAPAPIERGREEESLFDGLPRKKQKQILGIIGGIQSGIRQARQTAEDLQGQLDGLQEALGIGTDGDDEA